MTIEVSDEEFVMLMTFMQLCLDAFERYLAMSGPEEETFKQARKLRERLNRAHAAPKMIEEPKT